MRLIPASTVLAVLGGPTAAKPLSGTFGGIPPRQASGLNAAMVAAGRSYIGMSLAIRRNNQEQSIMGNKNELGSVTPENAMKWEM